MKGAPSSRVNDLSIDLSITKGGQRVNRNQDGPGWGRDWAFSHPSGAEASGDSLPVNTEDDRTVKLLVKNKATD